MLGEKIMLGNGNLCRFWDEAFGPNPTPLKDRFPEIYGVCRDQECTVHEVVGKQFNIPFRRNIMGNLLIQWQEVINYVNSIPFPWMRIK